jgi:hypothetical protein
MTCEVTHGRTSPATRVPAAWTAHAEGANAGAATSGGKNDAALRRYPHRLGADRGQHLIEASDGRDPAVCDGERLGDGAALLAGPNQGVADDQFVNHGSVA